MREATRRPPPLPPTRRDLLRLTAAGISGVTLSGVLAACTRAVTQSDGSPASSATPGPTSRNAVDVTAFGAVGDGRTDDTKAIQRALDATKARQTLTFPPGKTFLHSDVLNVNSAGVTLTGGGLLLAGNEERSAFKIAAADVTVDGLAFDVKSTTQRWSTPDQHKVFVAGVDGVTLRNLHVRGSAAAGVFCLGATNFTLENLEVEQTRADGIHMTYGSRNGRVLSPHVSRSGDDGVAVVSYLEDNADCHDIEIVSPVIDSTSGGRGISVVGGYDIVYRDISVTASNAAAVYIACEGDPSNTSDTRAVTVSGGRISGANTNSDIDHGAVLVYCGRSGGMVSDVAVGGLSIEDTRSGASRQIGAVVDGDDDHISGLVFTDVTLATSPPPYQGNAPATDVTLKDVTAAGHAVTVGS